MATHIRTLIDGGAFLATILLILTVLAMAP